MTHRIQTVTAKENYIVEALFYSGEIKQYDMKSLFSVFPQWRTMKKVCVLICCNPQKNAHFYLFSFISYILSPFTVCTFRTSVTPSAPAAITTLSFSVSKPYRFPQATA